MLSLNHDNILVLDTTTCIYHKNMAIKDQGITMYVSYFQIFTLNHDFPRM